MSGRIRVLVVDDSALMRKLIPQALVHDPSIEVVGTAMDGELGLKKITELHPHVVTLDLDMPRMDGIEMLRQITRKHRVPVIVVSSQTDRSASLTLKALALGAFDFVAKPQDAAAGRIDQIAAELAIKIKVAAASGAPKMIITIPSTKRKESGRSSMPHWPTRIVAIGVSTGGPNALQYLLSQIPADFPATFVVVQHMPEGFTDMFARRLDECCGLDVQEAKSGDLLVAGRVLICPGNRHIMVRRMPRGEMVVLSDSPPINGHRPSVNVLFHSVAQEFALTAVGVLMTGMGEDGAEGLGAIKAAGGMTIAQSEDTCVVSGMPRAAISKGYAAKVVALENLGAYLVNQYGTDRSNAEKAEPHEKSDKPDKSEKPERTPVSTSRA